MGRLFPPFILIHAVGGPMSVSKIAAISAVGTAMRNVLFASEADYTVAAVPSFYMDAGFIDEH